MRYGIPASLILALARTRRWAMVGSGTRKARAISAVVSPPSSRSVSATRAAVRQRRVAAGEDEPQPVVAHGALLGWFARAACSSAAWALLGRRAAASRRSRSMARLRAVVMIHPAGLGGSPAAGHRLDRLGERVLDRLLGDVDVAEDAGQDGHRAAVLLAEDALDRRRARPGTPASSALGHVDHRPDLDRQLARGRGLARPSRARRRGPAP